MTREEFNFKGVQIGSSLIVNEWVLTFTGKGGSRSQYWKVDAAKNGEIKYKEACKTLANWKDIIFGPEEGKTTSAKIPAKVDNSQMKGEHKITSVTLSANKKQKRLLKAWRAMLQVHRIYCPEATDIPAAMWEVLNAEDVWYNHIEEVKKQLAIEKAEAEAELKRVAELKVKKLAELIKTIQNEQQVLLSYGMSEAQIKTLLEGKFNPTNVALALK